MPKKRDYKKEYKKRSRASKLAGWYKSSDKKAGRENNLTTEHIDLLINLPCVYCGISDPQKVGIDRKSTLLGHTIKNSVPSCFKCNIILTTLNYESKLILAEGLRELRKKGLLDEWSPPRGKPFGC